MSDLGESRVQDAERKIDALAGCAGLRWHLIGHLQTNKANKAVQLFHTIHSIDSARVAAELNKEARKIAAGAAREFTFRGLIEINAAREENKYGLPPEKDALLELLKQCAELKALHITGLMGMAPYAENPEPVSRPVFKRLRELLDEANASKVYPRAVARTVDGHDAGFSHCHRRGRDNRARRLSAV